MCQRPMLVEGLLPAVVKIPPIYKSVPLGRMVHTAPPIVIPLPNSDHDIPSHLAKLLANELPARSKKPTAYKSSPTRAIPRTLGGPVVLESPAPKPDQLIPSHRAIAGETKAPGFEKSPPAIKLASSAKIDQT